MAIRAADGRTTLPLASRVKTSKGWRRATLAKRAPTSTSTAAPSRASSRGTTVSRRRHPCTAAAVLIPEEEDAVTAMRFEKEDEQKNPIEDLVKNKVTWLLLSTNLLKL
ncbi:uncharacterized protein LOC119340602 [Triticum dicoccoides]|uniref:uncharacterized protein LOC119340602 n=1 Tax=Triticum dicoccoides TaxID=85692 RepID=UPI001890E203|nr:uncharacterized protein LOC119340602 [Triticum dicoccoides]XP_044432810.1 uncharacterized protein LOC123159075 [Triticum aestivum]